jgi:hypothetical protein
LIVIGSVLILGPVDGTNLESVKEYREDSILDENKVPVLDCILTAAHE